MGYAKLCAWCGAGFISERAARGRFCGKSCSAKWRMQQPEVRAKVFTPEARAKGAAKNKGQKRPSSSLWHRLNNCMRNPETRAKLSATLRRIGHQPKERGGNGRGPTKAEAHLLALLGPEWKYNFCVKLNGRPYKIDVAHPEKKIAIEADGSSHAGPVARERDLRKQTWLEALGWKVLRLKNAEALRCTTSKLEGTPLMSWLET